MKSNLKTIKNEVFLIRSALLSFMFEQFIEVYFEIFSEYFNIHWKVMDNSLKNQKKYKNFHEKKHLYLNINIIEKNITQSRCIKA